MHYSRKCRCIISILEINFVSEWIRSCQWNTYWASSLGTARFLTKFDSVRFYFSSKKEERRMELKWKWEWRKQTLECNFIVKWKKTKQIWERICLIQYSGQLFDLLGKGCPALHAVYGAFTTWIYSATTWIYGSQWFTVPHV